jgi:hypothetical protein
MEQRGGAYRVLRINLRKRVHLEDLGVGGMTILKYVLKK